MGQGFWEVVPHRIDKITRGEGANLGEVLGHAELANLTELTKLQGV